MQSYFLQKKPFFFFVLFFISITISCFIFYSYIGLKNFHIPLGDTFGYYYPQRFFISSSIRHSIFPLWDQWRKNGGSLSSGIISINFSPIVLFFSLFGVYSLKTLIIEMLFIQILCFIGMYLWLQTYSNKYFALYGAFCYSLSAPVVSSTTEYGILVNISLIPLTAFAISKSLRGSKRYIAILALLLVLDFTQGYLGTNIMFLPMIFL